MPSLAGSFRALTRPRPTCTSGTWRVWATWRPAGPRSRRGCGPRTTTPWRSASARPPAGWWPGPWHSPSPPPRPAAGPRGAARRFDRLPRSTYGRHQVFTGPYRITAGPGGLLPPADAPRITLARNPSWDSDEDFRPAFADRIVLDQRSPGAVALARRVLGGRAAVNGTEPARADLVRALRARRAQVALPLAGEITFIALNTRLAPFDDPDVRRAVSAALDPDALRQALGGAVVGAVPTHWIPPGVPGFTEAGGRAGPGVDFLAFRRGNLALARRYLGRAGYTRDRITGLPVLELVARRQASGVAFAAVTRKALTALGLRSRVRLLAFGPFIRRRLPAGAQSDQSSRLGAGDRHVGQYVATVGSTSALHRSIPPVRFHTRGNPRS